MTMQFTAINCRTWRGMNIQRRFIRFHAKYYKHCCYSKRSLSGAVSHPESNQAGVTHVPYMVIFTILGWTRVTPASVETENMTVRESRTLEQDPLFSRRWT